ncbi:MAG: hypothetical protein GX928_05495 [Ruminococcaceae bacterium]|nr:hypothetical protein [Oscillospiraceae bacterium]
MDSVDYQEIKRMIGYRSNVVEDSTDSLIRECWQDVNESSRFRHVEKVFPLTAIEGGILLGESRFYSKDLSNHLSLSDSVLLYAATLGLEIDRLISKSSHVSMAKAVVLQASATVLLEKLSDKAIDDITGQKNKTARFSPGYGDLSLEYQGEILKILDAKKRIGLYSTDYHILIPSKSITSFSGLGGQCTESGKKCADCSMTECPYRLKGGA